MYPQTVYEIRYNAFGGDSELASNELIIPKAPEKGKSSYSFSWKTNFKEGTNNWINNNVFDRRKASNKLVKEILEWYDMEKFDEIVLYGHSHGGNVAIQAAEKLAKVFKNVYIITVATPAMTNPEIKSENLRLGSDLKISSFKFQPNPFKSNF